MGSSVRISWTDFPTVGAVEKVIHPFREVRRDEWGEILSGGNLYISAENEWTRETRAEIEAAMPENFERGSWDYGKWFHKTVAQIYEERKHIKEEASSKKQWSMKNPENPATYRQRMALHRMTGCNTTEWALTKAQASELIGKHKSGQDITEELKELGLITPPQTGNDPSGATDEPQKDTAHTKYTTQQ
ncbi:hypothetical protein SAMN05444972_102332 [Marininema halotolerans]|uniref:Uncharacterized protein n=2 Tax=Marininema halotolerans TaxID=1155944 RepID=A0A1I6Q4G0_9BACL|nr:hypothetical protein SAMN05444972_102332 [Marininema halotolerans]